MSHLKSKAQIVSISPWELVPGTTQLEVIRHLDGDSLIEYVQSEKKMIRANAEAKGRKPEVIENNQPSRQEIVISAMEVNAALMAKR